MTKPNTPTPDQTDATEAAPVDTNKLVAERREKLAAIRAQGVAFPNDFKPADRADKLHAAHDGTEAPDLEAQAVVARVGGRLMLKRVMGKACFGTLQDATGRIQVYVTLDNVGAESLAAFKHWDLGDILGAEGTLFKTKTGELSIKVTSIRLLTKALRPLPDKFHGMTDQEQKYRQRYVDLIVGHRLHPRLHGRQRLPGSRDAHDAPHPRRRQRQALHHPPQRARSGDVPAHRARAVPQAPGGRRLRARVRDQPQLP